jgi:TonB-linked SusC/RagA family outer membrane protein
VRFRSILLAAVMAVAIAAPAVSGQQTGTVTGTVKNKQTGAPLSGAQVSVTNTRVGAVTDAQGRFSIPGVPAGTHTLSVQYLGFSEVKRSNVVVAAGATANASFDLEPTVLSMQELVVTGVSDPTAGVKLPFTVSRVGAAQLEVPTTNSALASIQGKVAGASIIRGSGQPGSGVNIMLRSATSIGEGPDNSPLIVVDGVVIARTFGGTTSDIESLDIENVEIIKGAAAASLYGSRAQAGVVSITTRKGKDNPVGTTRITSRTEIGKSFIGREVPLTTKHHYLMNAEGNKFINSAGRDTTWGGRTRRPIPFQDQEYPQQTYDNIGAVYQPGQFLTQNFTMTHNTPITTFLVGMSRTDEAGALTNNEGYWRNTGRVSIDHRLGEKFSLSLAGSHVRTWQDGLSGDPYTAAVNYAPIVDLKKKDANGNYLQLPDSTVLTENPLWRQSSRDNWDARARTFASANVRYAFAKWLTVDAQYSYDRSDIKGQVYVPKGTPTSVTSDNPSDGQLDYDQRGTDAHNGSIATTIVRSFADFNTRITARGLFEREKTEYFYVQGTDFLVQGTRDLDAAATLNDMSSSSSDTRSNGMLINGGFDYKDKYIIDLVARRDGSSLFGPANKWHNYYRAAAAWRLAEEEWFNLPHIDEFKIRYAAGTAGGRPSFSQQYATWNVSTTGGLTRVTAGNPALKPQFTLEQEFGIDMIGLNNRVSLELVYAKQRSDDQIIAVPIPVITGYNSVYANAGEVAGHTYEATLQAQIINRTNLRWQLGAVADVGETRITRWDRACFYGSNAGRDHEFTCEGERLGDFYARTFVKSPEQLRSAMQSRASEFQVNDEGYLVWVGPGNQYTEGVTKSLWGTSTSVGGVTYNWGEPIVWQNDTTGVAYNIHSGKSSPDLNFGITNNFRLGNFTVYGLLRGQLGGEVYNNVRQAMYNTLRHADLDQSGKPDELKKPVDYYQRALYSGNNWVDIYLEDATHLKLSELSVRYRVGKSTLSRVLGNAAPTDVTFGLVGRNLLTLTGYKGFDPEAGSQLSRVENFRYPQLRTFTATFDITF